MKAATISLFADFTPWGWYLYGSARVPRVGLPLVAADAGLTVTEHKKWASLHFKDVLHASVLDVRNPSLGRTWLSVEVLLRRFRRSEDQTRIPKAACRKAVHWVRFVQFHSIVLVTTRVRCEIDPTTIICKRGRAFRGMKKNHSQNSRSWPHWPPSATNKKNS